MNNIIMSSTDRIVVSNRILAHIESAKNQTKKLGPQSRETSIVVTKLDEARLWLNEWVDVNIDKSASGN